MKRLQRLNYYQVEAIKDVKTDQTGKRFYLVKWKDWEEKFNTWQPLNNLQTVKTLIRNFQQSIQARKRPNVGQGNDQYKPDELSPDEEDKQDVNGVEPAQPKKTTERRKKEGQQLLRQAMKKRKRGRPKMVRPLGWIDTRKRKIEIKKESPKQPAKLEEQTDIKTEALLVPFPTPPKTEKPLASLPNKDTVSPSRRRMGLMRRRRQIRKDRVTQRLTGSARKESMDQAFDKEQQQDEKQESEEEQQNVEYNEHQSLAESNDQQEDELGLEQVLLKCKNYTHVKVSLKDNKFFYQVPYEEDGKVRSIVLTAQQIIKVNPKWFQGYFQGFFL